MILVLGPYSSSREWEKIFRFTVMSNYLAHCIHKGEFVMSVVVHFHQLSQDGKLPSDYDFWERYIHNLIWICDSVRVIKLSGWQESYGLQQELTYMDANNIPYEFIEVPEDFWETSSI
jgi:hypothetical protein